MFIHKQHSRASLQTASRKRNKA